MSEVFLTHATEDTERLRPLVQALRAHDVDVWWDQLATGGTRLVELQERVEKARCVLVCWTRASVDRERDWVRSEAEKARERGTLLPVLLDVVPIPSPFDQRLAVDLSSWNGDAAAPAFLKLLEDIRAMVAPRRRALLIGVSQFGAKSGLAPLPAVRRDVDALESALQSRPCLFQVTKLHDPDSTEMMRAFETLHHKTQPGDFSLVYYAGYALNHHQTVSLAAHNTDRECLRATTLDLSWPDLNGDGELLVVLDVCYGNAPLAEVGPVLRSLVGNQVLAAPVGSRPADWESEHGPLTRHLLQALRTHDADKNGDHIVRVAELLQYLDQVYARADEDHMPLHWTADVALTEQPLARWGRVSRSAPVALTEEQDTFVNVLAPEVAHGKVVPFLGDAIYGRGPLSFRSLADVLGKRGGIRLPNEGLATIAESCQIVCGERADFLEELGEIVEAQIALSKGPFAAHDLVLSLRRPWTVISVNYDDVLERRLAEAKQPFVLIAHILRSESGEEDGRVLVVRSDEAGKMATEICLAQELVLKDDDCVVYKLLGAPFLHQLPIAKERRLDTVVITETDHIDFLANLRHSATAVPAALGNRCRKRLLFLSFSLNVWHYRLVSHVFQNRSTSGKREAGSAVLLLKSPFVVRSTSTALEDDFWRRLAPETKVSIDLRSLTEALREREGR